MVFGLSSGARYRSPAIICHRATLAQARSPETYESGKQENRNRYLAIRSQIFPAFLFSLFIPANFLTIG
jgi:hypothetical protein